MQFTSKLGMALALIYIVLSVWLIATQGLFGESFITLILGLPWTLLLAYFEFGNVEGALLYVLVLTPLVINALILYWIGSLIENNRRSVKIRND